MKYAVTTVFILSYEVADKSGCTIVRAYTDAARANQDHQLVKDLDTARTWKVQEIPMIDAEAKSRERSFGRSAVGTKQ